MFSTNIFLSLNCKVRTEHGLGTITKSGSKKNLVVVTLRDGTVKELKAKDVHALDHRTTYCYFAGNKATHDAKERAIEAADFVGAGATVWETNHTSFTEYEMVPQKSRVLVSGLKGVVTTLIHTAA